MTSTSTAQEAGVSVPQRQCADCGTHKSIDEFYVHKSGTLYTVCKRCHLARTQVWREKNRARVRELDRVRYHGGDRVRKINEKRLRKYGLSPAAFDALMEKQGGVCAICRKPFADSYSGLSGHGAGAGRWDIAAVDHDHETGQVRGILHRRCNLAIEFLLTDQDLLRARRYLGLTESGGDLDD